MSKNPDYFSVLNCSKDATFEELKQNYQQLIRKCHPDKNGGSEEDFILIDKAWKTLRDESSKTQYINSQTQDELDKSHCLIHAELCKEKLIFNNEDIVNYPCRCGSEFVICKDYLKEEEIVIECNECTNCIVVR